VDLVDETATVVNAGHPHPFRLRGGRAEEIVFDAQQRFDMAAGTSWHTQAFSLGEGDRVLFLTDGMFERNAEDLDTPQLLLASAHLHPREAIQFLTHAVLDAVDGDLRDDATSLCLD
jgi:serine phosphatase RsbU (regulator of sigma subunit)